jgi:AAA family ATP:ADP antiporter
MADAHLLLISFSSPSHFFQGVVTMALMLASPSLFKSIGWKGVAAATPQILLATGLIFFVACLLYQYLIPSLLLLNVVVLGGAFVFVFSRSAKFSLFKPAEEMVYISLDQDGRTKGKAAIDVVGAQLGKASGSFLQQALLLISGGAIAGSIAPMSAVFMLFNLGWLESVNRLSNYNPNYGSKASVHEDLISLKSMDSDDESM